MIRKKLLLVFILFLILSNIFLIFVRGNPTQSPNYKVMGYPTYISGRSSGGIYDLVGASNPFNTISENENYSVFGGQMYALGGVGGGQGEEPEPPPPDPPSFQFEDMLFRHGTSWRPDPVWNDDGLNTTFTLGRTLQLDGIDYPNKTLRMTKDGEGYWIRAGLGGSRTLDINNWFDTFGTSVTLTSAGTTTMQLYIEDEGYPSRVAGADAWSWDSTENVIEFTGTASSDQEIIFNWGSGATTELLSPTFTGLGQRVGSVAGRGHEYVFRTKVWIASGEKVKRKRTRNEIVRDILHVAKGGAKKTHIQYKCNLSFTLLEKYLARLLKMELLEARTLYHATEKGLRFLEAYETLERLLGVEAW